MICGNNLEQYVHCLKISLVASQCFLRILSAGLLDHGFIKNCLALPFQRVFKDERNQWVGIFKLSKGLISTSPCSFLLPEKFSYYYAII
jgi:hypothetical protein